MAASPREAAVVELRQQLRQRLRGAWSQEAVRRGVAHARAGEQEQALACYSQVGGRDWRPGALMGLLRNLTGSWFWSLRLWTEGGVCITPSGGQRLRLAPAALACFLGMG